MKIIPWDYKDVNFMKSWEWDTAHFSASVRSDGERFFYIVLDKSQGLERSIASGDSLSFIEAELLIKEVVGKTYPARLGYQAYTGKAGTSFRVYTGEVIDFQEYDGVLVNLDVITKNEKKQTFTGTLRLAGHEISIYPDTKTKIKIPPSFIYAITKSDGKSSLPNARTTRDITSARPEEVSRTVAGRYILGCTGRDGFTLGTVAHAPSSPWCPIHQV